MDLIPGNPVEFLASSSTARRWKYDVFLNFMAETEKGFITYLYHRLQTRGITAFMNEPGVTVEEAIEGSRLAIVVISRNYGSTPSCLEQLQKIFEVMEEDRRILAVFYDIDPTYFVYEFEDETLEHDLTVYEMCGQDVSKIRQSRAALIKVCGLAEWDAQNYKTELDLLEDIVKVVHSKIQPAEVSQSPDSITGMRTRKLTDTNWKKTCVLGSGSFGIVNKAISDDGFFIAVKEVSLLDEGTLGRKRIFQLEQEIALLSQFEHENIVQYYGTQKDESKLYIFLELVTEGSLRDIYLKCKLTDSHVSVYTKQILQGLKYLHDQKVIHRDIKCANILVHANGSVKLADFGLAKIMKTNDIKSFQGTAHWMAPEVVRCKSVKGYGLPSDIWSLGCTVLEMLTGKLPYLDLEPHQAVWRIGNKELPHVPDYLSREAQDFIHLCIKVEPDDRPTAAQLLKHPFVN